MDSPTRYAHAPGDVLPVYVTADAAKLLRIACRLVAGDNEALARKESQPQMKSMRQYNSFAYTGLARELERAVNETEGLDRAIGLEDRVLVGEVLFEPRLVALTEDIEELRRRLRGEEGK